MSTRRPSRVVEVIVASHTNKVVESLVVVVYDELLESLRNSDASSPDVGRYLAYGGGFPSRPSGSRPRPSSNSSLSLPASMSIQYRLRFGEVVSVVKERTASALVESIAASGAAVCCSTPTTRTGQMLHQM